MNGLKEFKKWEVKNLPRETIYLTTVQWHLEGFKVALETKDSKKTTLIFDETVYLYKITDVSYKPSCWVEKEEDYYPFYYSKNSEDIRNLKEEVDYIQEDTIYHFIMIQDNLVLEVFTSSFPKIKCK